MFVRYALIADAIFPGDKGKQNISGTFTCVIAKKFPTSRRVFFLAKIEGSLSEEGEHDLRVDFVDDDFNKLLPSPNLQLKLSSEGRPVETIPLATDIVIEYEQLAIPKPGNYEFIITVNGRHLGSVPLYARKEAETQ